MRGILAFVAAASAWLLGAQAQAPQSFAAEPPIPRYEVEVIVFAHRDFDPTEERFDQAPNGFGSTATLREAPYFDETAFAPPGIPAPPATPPLAQPPVAPSPLELAAAARAEALRVRPLRPEELKLTTEYRKLRAIAAYQPLVHVGWVQPGLPEADSTAIDLGTLGVINPRGTVRVHLTRYLHVTLDLTYQAPASTTPAQSSVDGLDELTLAPQYRLAATRRVISTELHYFDHPAFGVLVRITPVPTADGGRRPAA